MPVWLLYQTLFYCHCLPRNAMHKCGLCRHALSICLSACPSICHAHRLLKWINVTSKFFSPSGSHTILVFPYQTSWQYFNGDPIMEALNAGGVGKNRDSQLISGYRDRRLVECKQQLRWSIVQFTAWTATHQWSCLASEDDLLREENKTEFTCTQL